MKMLSGAATLVALCILFVAPRQARAGEYASIAELGIKFYSATTTPSLTGSYGFFLNMHTEKRKGIFRLQSAAEIEYATGTARFSEDDTPTFTMISGNFLGGVNLFMFSEANFLPFIGGNAILGWNILRLSGQAEGVEANTEGLSYGYELSAGCDIRKSAGADDAVRIRTSYWKSTSTLGGASGFQLSGWRISFGIMF